MEKVSYYTSHTILNRTDKQRQLPQAINNVFHAYTCAVKNIENSANFVIRNLISSYAKVKNIDIDDNNQEQNSLDDKKPEYIYQLKSNLYPNEKLCIDLANQAIDLMNTKKDELIKSKAQKIVQGIKPRKRVAKKIKLDDNYNNNSIHTKEKKIRYLKPFVFEVNKTTFYQHIDTSLICNVLKLKDRSYPQYKDFILVNSHIAMVAVENVINNYNNFYKAIKAYYKNPNSFIGKPQMPSYHGKNHLCGFSLNKDRFKAKDKIAARVITKNNIEDFTSIRDKSNVNQLFLDTTKTLPVNDKDSEFYNTFNLMPLIEEKIKKVYENEKTLLDKLENIYNRHSNKNTNEKNKRNKFTAELAVEFVELKVIPLVRPNKIGSTVELQIVVKHSLNLPEYSMLNKLLKYNPKFLELSEKDKITCVQHYTKKILHDDERLSFNVLSKNINELFRIGSIDLGVKYPCSLTFNEGSEALIISGKEYYKAINNIDGKIDKRKEELNNSTIKGIKSQFDKNKNSYNENKEKIIAQIKLSKEYIEFAVKNSDKLEQETYLNSLVIKILTLNNISYPELSKQDKALLEQYNNNCRNDSYLVAQQKYKNNYIDDYVHQLSTKIIALCLSKRLDFLTIGKNDLWKQNSNIGRKNNRAFYNFPHSKLIELLQYKALKFGIVILVTEESYTSKTSFINDATLKTFDKKEREAKVVNTKNSTENIPRDKKLLNNANKKADKLKENPYGGYRKSREQYINKDNVNNNKEKALKVVHADINASYNIMRKIFIDIKYDKNYHNVNYNLVSLRSNKKAFKSIIKNKLSL